MVPVEGALLKLECLQPTGSFKVRGFFAAATQAQISMPERVRHGLITVSAGNAAQACAYAAHSLGVPCRVVMFDTAPATKIAQVVNAPAAKLARVVQAYASKGETG